MEYTPTKEFTGSWGKANNQDALFAGFLVKGMLQGRLAGRILPNLGVSGQGQEKDSFYSIFSLSFLFFHLFMLI